MQIFWDFFFCSRFSISCWPKWISEQVSWFISFIQCFMRISPELFRVYLAHHFEYTIFIHVHFPVQSVKYCFVLSRNKLIETRQTTINFQPWLLIYPFQNGGDCRLTESTNSQIKSGYNTPITHTHKLTHCRWSGYPASIRSDWRLCKRKPFTCIGCNV